MPDRLFGLFACDVTGINQSNHALISSVALQRQVTGSLGCANSEVCVQRCIKPSRVPCTIIGHNYKKKRKNH